MFKNFIFCIVNFNKHDYIVLISAYWRSTERAAFLC